MEGAIPGARPAPGSAASLAAGTFGLVAVLSGVAAGIHLGVAPEHFGEWWGYGAFFVLAAAGECGLVALLALRPRAWVVQVGIWASLVTMLMYLVSRTAGIPFGPATGVVEPVDLLGLAATACEGAHRRRALPAARRTPAGAHAECPRPRGRSPVAGSALRRAGAAGAASGRRPRRPRVGSSRAHRDGRALHPGQCAKRAAAAR